MKIAHYNHNKIIMISVYKNNNLNNNQIQVNNKNIVIHRLNNLIP